MVLMLIGSGMIGWGVNLETLVAGRVVAGTGGVILNVVMSKMVVGWFVDREISTAMAIFINSWPVGIAVALVVLPLLAALGEIELALAAVMSTNRFGFVSIYRCLSGSRECRQTSYQNQDQ